MQGELRASAAAPPGEQIEKFRKMLQRAGRGRIRLHVDIHYGQTVGHAIRRRVCRGRAPIGGITCPEN